MSEYTPTTQQVEDGFAHEPEYEYHNPIGYGSHVQANRQAFRRWLEEVKCEAAAEALVSAAEEEARVSEAYSLTSEGMRDRKEWADSIRYSTYAAAYSAAAYALRARAEVYRRNEDE